MSVSAFCSHVDILSSPSHLGIAKHIFESKYIYIIPTGSTKIGNYDLYSNENSYIILLFS